MSGVIYPLHIKDIRDEAEHTTDKHLITDKILYIDRVFTEEWNKKK